MSTLFNILTQEMLPTNWLTDIPILCIKQLLNAKKVYLIEGGGAIIPIMNNVELTTGRIEFRSGTSIIRNFIFNQLEAKCTRFIPPYNLKRTGSQTSLNAQTTYRLEC